MAETERMRLHICPFNTGLYDTIIPKSLQPVATGVSYHAVQTFPERGFGYVELPKPDADKLRKKLNGFILKGQKMNIQEAKPEKRRRDKEHANDDNDEKPRKKPKKEKSKKKDGEIAGFELPGNRHIKRGWTEEPGKSSKKSHDVKHVKDKTLKREKSKYTSTKEVLFKQKLPESATIAQKSSDTKEKKDKKDKKPKHHVVIHEFENTKKHPTFLKSQVSADSGIASEFVEGKGWVDADGNVVEAVKLNPKREDRIAQIPEVPMEIRISKPAPQEPAAQSIITAGAKALDKADKQDDSENDSESDESTSDESESDEIESEAEKEEEEVISKPSSSSVTKPSPAEEESEAASEPEADSSSTASQDGPLDQDENEAMDIDTESPHPATPPREIHPLEALFKRPKPDTSINETPRPAPIDTSFSFFDTANDNNEEIHDNCPQTPFNPNEGRGRGIRSAAPTPDTAAIGRKFSFSFANRDIEEEDDDDDDDQDEDTNQIPLGSRTTVDGDGEEKQETDFSKWFWENRGDTNRAWKKRRRDVLKVKRQRENRRLSRRIV